MSSSNVQRNNVDLQSSANGRGNDRRARCRPRRGFTLVEVMTAAIIAAFVLGSISMGMSQLGRAKNTSKLRFDAHLRADAALNAIRRDVASILRRDDLFYTRFLILNEYDSVRTRDEYLERDSLLVFNTRLRAIRDIDFQGEGFEHETQFRVVDDEGGPVLWTRYDSVPDEYPQGGGVVTPTAEGIIALKFEAYDGYGWYEEWDSDMEGLPLAVRITVVASGHRELDDLYTAPRAVLRTVVAIDRVIPPKDLFKDPDEENEEDAIPDDSEQTEPDADRSSENSPTGGRPTGGGGSGGGRPNASPRPNTPQGQPTGGGRPSAVPRGASPR